MEAIDLFIIPLYIIILFVIAYSIRERFTNKFTKKYFLPALALKFIGAISIGLVYYFYYPGGDTKLYFRASSILYDALLTEPGIGIKMLFANGEFDPQTYKYTSKMDWYTSPPEYTVIRLSAALGLFGFGTYSATALFFASLSFTGVWAAYLTFLKIFPKLHKEFAISVLFIPSVFFWGSGLMKDSITLGSLGWLFYGFYSLTIEKRRIFFSLVITSIACILIYTIKVYILLAFLPPALLWIFNENNKRIKNNLLRNLAKPLFLIIGGSAGYVAATTLTAGSEQYDVSNIAERTKINNEYLTTYTGAGSAYDIGTFDGTIESMLMVAPQAINVAIFRPYLWEIRNPFMLLSAIESLVMLLLTLKIFFKVGILNTFKLIGSEPIVLFCMIFSLIFAFAVGTNSGNFGTLVRYKIPLMPFYLSALFIMESKVREHEKMKKALKKLKMAKLSNPA